MATSRILRSMVLLAGFTLVAAPRPAAASIEPTSSMRALCMGPAGSRCSVVDFILSIGIPTNVNRVSIFTADVANWAFTDMGGGQQVNQVYDETGSTLLGTWTGFIQNDATLSMDEAVGMAIAAPIRVRTYFDTFSGSLLGFGYNGSGNTYWDPVNNKYTLDPIGRPIGVSVSGNVTPEPMSLLLLGSGLVGVAGAVRRRRRQAQDA